MKGELINGSGRIEALREKEKAIRAQIAAENQKQQKKKARDRARLFRVVGAALVEHAAQSPDGFGLMLRQVLATAVTDSKDIAFLRRKGMM
jgi:uncharacterized membrane protein